MPGPTLTGFDSYAAQVAVPTISVYAQPAASPLARTFPNTAGYGAPETFLIEREQHQADGTWYEVLLPIRPNGSTGWVRASDVKVVGIDDRIRVHLGSLTLQLVQHGTVTRTYPIGIGTVDTPTPPGEYFIEYLMRPSDQNTIYGHYVYGLSGYAPTLANWPGGGELGIHGTNNPAASIGRRVSHGCVRLSNTDIESLVPVLPLGTPVDVDTA
ncbi:MAG TPA: L,D-transpeptidase [Acidimicrobiales bacterium]|nr:L,D-transpeptidase [Acidimicrobiales bacterium]